MNFNCIQIYYNMKLLDIITRYESSRGNFKGIYEHKLYDNTRK